ncbi:hypothetical protein TPDSL_23100 [Terrisporobacter petrolearius]|uniref:hypothetical protein n=1 Tax=Terrisporobacter petrolearius TaxID=1460447 RepID=UPI003365BBB6
MKDYFECSCASIVDNSCVLDIYNKAENIRKFPMECKICDNYGNCTHCSLEDTTYCNRCINFKNK